MRNFLISINLILLFAVLTAGQNPKNQNSRENLDGDGVPKVEKRGDSQSNTKKASKNSEEPGKVLLESGTMLDAKLLSTLNAKNTEVGDEVMLKLTKSIKQDGEVIVPKGTRLIGRITEVKRKTKGDKSSRLSMVFDKLQNKRLTAPINASIVSIASAAGNLQAGDLFGGSASGSSTSSGRASSGGGLGGGLLGGATSTAAGALSTTTSAVGGVTDTVGGTVAGATPAVGRSLKGIQLSQSLNANAEGSSTLSAENKNVKLNKGTQFRIQLNESVQN